MLLELRSIYDSGMIQHSFFLIIIKKKFQLAAIAFSRQSRTGFDSLWLEDLYETRIIETQGSKISPLVVNPGHIMLTDSALYYQPFNNVEPVSMI